MAIDKVTDLKIADGHLIIRLIAAQPGKLLKSTGQMSTSIPAYWQASWTANHLSMDRCGNDIGSGSMCSRGYCTSPQDAVASMLKYANPCRRTAARVWAAHDVISKMQF